MCGIAGFYKIEGEDDPTQFYEYFGELLQRVGIRGPDYFGAWARDTKGYYAMRVTLPNETGKFSQNFRDAPKRNHKVMEIMSSMRADLGPMEYWCSNFRGVPTTEAVISDTNGQTLGESIQPFLHRNQVVTHNGLFSNDQDLYAERGFPHLMSGVDHDIDSYVLIHLFREWLAHTASPDASDLQDHMSVLKGSWAYTLYDYATRTMAWSRSFRDLYLGVWKWGDTSWLVWSSEEAAINPPDNRAHEFAYVEFPQDTTLVVQPEQMAALSEKAAHQILRSLIARHVHTSSPRSRYNEESCAVVLSGGLDSTVCATWVCNRYKHVHLLHFLYGARAERKEWEACERIQARLKQAYPDVEISLELIPLDFIKNLGGSTLTEHDLEIATGEEGVETTHEWVPARNTAMIGLAASYCDRLDIGAIVLGLNMEEGGVFEDNSIEYYRKMEQALQIGTKSKPRMLMPLGNLMKHHIVRMGIDLKAPLDISWSCYLGHGERCGVCGPCIMRQRAYAINKFRDPVAYTTRDPVAESILQKGGIDEQL